MGFENLTHFSTGFPSVCATGTGRRKRINNFYKLQFFFFYIIHLQYALQDSNTDRKKVLKMFYFENLLDSYWSVALTGSVSKVLGTEKGRFSSPPGLCNQWLRCSIKTHYWIVCTENSPSSPNDCLFKDHLNDYVCIIKDSFFVLSLPQLCDSRCYWATPENHCLAAGLSSHAKLLKPV